MSFILTRRLFSCKMDKIKRIFANEVTIWQTDLLIRPVLPSGPVTAAMAQWPSTGKNILPRAVLTAATAADGGSIIVRVDDNMSTLMDFRYKRKYVAGNGVDGQGRPQKRQGRPEPDHPCSPGHPDPGRRDRRDHQGHVRQRALCPVQGRPGRLGQPALRHPHPPGAPLCQGGPARREPRCGAGAEAAGGRGTGGLPQRGKEPPF